MAKNGRSRSRDNPFSAYRKARRVTYRLPLLFKGYIQGYNKAVFLPQEFIGSRYIISTPLSISQLFTQDDRGEFKARIQADSMVGLVREKIEVPIGELLDKNHCEFYLKFVIEGFIIIRQAV